MKTLEELAEDPAVQGALLTLREAGVTTGEQYASLTYEAAFQHADAGVVDAREVQP